MGNSLHVAKTYIIEWSDTEAFNHKPYEFRRLLNELNIGVSEYDDQYLDFEVLKDDWSNAIVRLQNVKDNIDSGVITEKCNAVSAILKELDCDINKCIRLFAKYLEVADPNDEWMHFSFF